MESHTKDSKLQCNDCDKEFTNKKSLSIHMRKHYRKSTTEENIKDTKSNESSNIIESCSI